MNFYIRYINSYTKYIPRSWHLGFKIQISCHEGYFGAGLKFSGGHGLGLGPTAQCTSPVPCVSCFKTVRFFYRRSQNPQIRSGGISGWSENKKRRREKERREGNRGVRGRGWWSERGIGFGGLLRSKMHPKCGRIWEIEKRVNSALIPFPIALHPIASLLFNFLIIRRSSLLTEALLTPFRFHLFLSFSFLSSLLC